MASSVMHRLIPALSIVAYGLAYEGEVLTFEAARGLSISWSDVQTMHVVLTLLTAFLVWRTILWYRRDQPFAYKWLIYILPLLGLQLLDWGWHRLIWYLMDPPTQGTSDADAERLGTATWNANKGCVPLMVILLAHVSSERAGMSRSITWLELTLVLSQTCITLGTLSSSLAQVDWVNHMRWTVDALLSALRIAYLGKVIRQQFVSEAQLFGLGAVEMLQPVEWVISLVQYPQYLSFTHDWLAEQHLFYSLYILLTNVLQTWIVPTLVLIALGSVAAAELETLRPSYQNLLWGRFAGVTTTDPPAARWDDSYRVYDGVNLALALVFLASAVRTRWLRDTAALQQKATQPLSQPLHTASGDEQVELVA